MDEEGRFRGIPEEEKQPQESKGSGEVSGEKEPEKKEIETSRELLDKTAEDLKKKGVSERELSKKEVEDLVRLVIGKFLESQTKIEASVKDLKVEMDGGGGDVESVVELTKPAKTSVGINLRLANDKDGQLKLEDVEVKAAAAFSLLIKEEIRKALKDPNESFREALNDELLPRGVEAQEIGLEFGKDNLSIAMKGGFVEESKEETTTDEELSKVREKLAGEEARKVNEEREERRKQIEKVLKFTGAEDTEAASQVFLRALEIADPKIQVEGYKKFGQIFHFVEGIKGEEIELEEEVKLIDLLKALLILLMKYVKRIIEEEVPGFAELGGEDEDEKVIGGFIEYEMHPLEKEMLEGKGEEDVLPKDLDPLMNWRELLFQKAFGRKKDRKVKTYKTTTGYIDGYLEGLKKLEAGETLTPEESKEFITLEKRIRKRLREDIKGLYGEEEAELREFFAKAKTSGFESPKAFANWIFYATEAYGLDVEELAEGKVSARDGVTGEPIEVEMVDEVEPGEAVPPSDGEPPEEPPEITGEEEDDAYLDQALRYWKDDVLSKDKMRLRQRQVNSLQTSEQKSKKFSELKRLEAELVAKKDRLVALLRQRDGRKDKALTSQEMDEIRDLDREMHTSLNEWNDFFNEYEKQMREEHEKTKSEMRERERLEKAASPVGDLLEFVQREKAVRSKAENQERINKYVLEENKDILRQLESRYYYQLDLVEPRLIALSQTERESGLTDEIRGEVEKLGEQVLFVRLEFMSHLGQEVDDYMKRNRESLQGPIYDVFIDRLDEDIKPEIEKLKDLYRLEDLKDDDEDLYNLVVQAEMRVDDFFEDLMDQAEDDPSESWNLRKNYLETVFDLFAKELDEVSPDIALEYKTRLAVRRGFHELGRIGRHGASVEDIKRIFTQYGESGHRDKVSDAVRGFEAGVALVEREFASLSRDPRNHRQIPQRFLDVSLEEDTIVRRVADVLLEYGKQGLLDHQGKPFSFTRSEDQKNYPGDKGKKRREDLALRRAFRVAAMSFNVYCADMRANEFMANAPQRGPEGSDAFLRSEFWKGVAEAMNPVKEDYERFEMQGEATEAQQAFIDEMNFAGQPEALVECEQNEIMMDVVPGRLCGLTAVMSNWRGWEATFSQRRQGLATGMEIHKLQGDYDPKNPEEKNKKIRDKKIKIWKETFQRMPSMMERFFETTIWEWGDASSSGAVTTQDVKKYGRKKRKSNQDEKNQWMRMRTGVLEDEGDYKKYITLRTNNNKTLVEKYEEAQRKLLIDVGEATGVITPDQRDENIKRRKVEVERLEMQRRAFIWMVGSNYEDLKAQRPKNFDVDSLEEWDKWESEVWKRWNGKKGLKEKIQVLERHSYKEYRDGIKKLEKEMDLASGTIDIANFHLDKPEDEVEWGEDNIYEEYRKRCEELRDKYRVLPLIKRVRGGESLLDFDAESFSDEDFKLIERFSLIGSKVNKKGEVDESRDRIAEHFADQRWIQVPYEDDIDFTNTEFYKGGQDGFIRRYGDAMLATQAKMKLTELYTGLRNFKDKLNIIGSHKEIIKHLFEYRESMGHISQSQRSDHVSAVSAVLYRDVFKADKWVDCEDGSLLKPGTYFKGFFGFLGDLRIPILQRPIDWEVKGKKIFGKYQSSTAQRRLGSEAVSMTRGEAYRFFQGIRTLVGNKNLKKIENLLEVRGRDAAASYLRQLMLPGIVGMGIYTTYKWITDGWGLLKEFLGQALQEGFQGQSA